MKKRLLFYSLVSLAMIVLIARVISWATETPPLQKAGPEASVTSKAIDLTATENKAENTIKKKTCGCCADRLARYREQLRKARERGQRGQHLETKAITQQTPAEASNSEHRDDY